MTTRKSKKEAQREQMRRNLIETAESLFAEHGIAAVSLRQIGEYAGSLNTSVVGYYFGSKEALIEAIYRFRLPSIEVWRTTYLEELERNGLGMDLGELLKVIWLPWYNQQDHRGRHSYGGFLRTVNREGLASTRFALDPEYPAGVTAHNRIKAILAESNVANVDFRFSMQINMILETLAYIDARELSPESSNAIFRDALDMARVALLTR